MGQIWDRISKLAKTYLQDSDDTTAAERIIQSDADELKRIIDELSEPKKQTSPPPKQHQQHQRHQQTQQKQQAPPPPPRPNTNGMTSAKATEILEIPKTATIQEIKSAYKKKVMAFHPDRLMNAPLPDQKKAEQKMVEINQAYQYLQLLKGF